MIATIERNWTDQNRWWEGDERRRDRRYFDVRCTDGLHAIIYEDRVVGGWFLEQVYD